MIQIGSIQTDKAERLMKALCNHIARKRIAHYEGNKGYIDFGDGKCELKVEHRTLTFRAEAESPEGLAHVKTAIDNHLGRFTPGENIMIEWKDLP